MAAVRLGDGNAEQVHVGHQLDFGPGKLSGSVGRLGIRRPKRQADHLSEAQCRQVGQSDAAGLDDVAQRA